MSNSPSQSSESQHLRRLEDAADEIARLDLLCSREVGAITVACWLAAVAATDPDPPSLDLFAAAAADPVHDLVLGESVLQIRSFAAAEERRVRSGTPPSLGRWEAIAPGLATYPNRERLEAVWRDGARGRPVLEHAIESAAWLDDPGISPAGADLGGLAIALLLCAAGRTAHLRYQPLAAADQTARRAASEAWRAGDQEPWAALALETLARGARGTREALRGLDQARERDEAAVTDLGRAGINARRALTHLHATLASTMPATAEALDLSRPAANAALERLVEAGVAREVTGRARDRVFAWVAPLDALRLSPRA